MDRGSIAGNCKNTSSWARLNFLNRKTSFSLGSHRLARSRIADSQSAGASSKVQPLSFAKESGSTKPGKKGCCDLRSHQVLHGFAYRKSRWEHHIMRG